MKRLGLFLFSFFATLGVLALMSCSDVTAPRTIKPATPSRDLECRSGYSVATGKNGEPVCVPDGEAGIQAIPRALPDTI